MERFLEYAEKVKNPPAAPAGPVLKIEKSTAEQQFLAERFGMLKRCFHGFDLFL